MTSSLLRARLLCAGALMLLAPLAHAQYSWIDEKGVRVFSDRAPPPGTPASRILQMPRQPGAASSQSAAAAPAPAAASTPTAVPAAATPPAAGKPAPHSLAEQEADYRKRTAERENDERKAAEASRKKAELATQCDAVRRSERTLASGTRVAEVNEKGEQVFLSDAERARRLAQARSTLAGCN